MAVLPRPRRLAGGGDGLAYLDWDEQLVRGVKARGGAVGFGGREERDLPNKAEFGGGADAVAEFALAILTNASWDAIKLTLQNAAWLLRRQLQPALDRGEAVEARIGIARLTGDSVEGLVVHAPTPEGASEAAERVIRAWFDARRDAAD